MIYLKKDIQHKIESAKSGVKEFQLVSKKSASRGRIASMFLSLVVLILSGCKSLDTNVKTAEKPLPSAFQNNTNNGENVADINWREYFGDSLLNNLIDTALVWNPDLNIALQRIEVARASEKHVRGSLLPQVSVGTLSGIRKYGLYTMDGAGNITTEMLPGMIVPTHLPDLNFGLQSAWELDIWGKLRNQRKAAAANFLASVEGTHFIVSSLINDIAIAYYTLIALDNELEIIRDFVLKQEEALAVIQLQKESGRANELAVQQFQAQVLNSRAMDYETRQRIVEAENLINFLIGRYPQAIERNRNDLFDDLPREIAAGIPPQLLSNRPDIRQAELEVVAGKCDLKAAKAAFLPNLNITASIGYQAFNAEYLMMSPSSIFYTALGGLVAPIINMNALKARFNTAKASQLEAMYEYQKTILNGFVEVANELSNLENLQEIVSLKQEQSEVLASSVETSTELFRSAKAGYIEVLLAQQNALQTQIELIEVSKRQRIATVNLYKALGGGWR